MLLAAIDFSKVKVSDFKGRFLVVNLGGKYKRNWNDAIVYGTITLELIPETNLVKIHADSDTMFDFDMKSWDTQTPRNIKTKALQMCFWSPASLIMGGGNFNINYTDYASINW